MNSLLRNLLTLFLLIIVCAFAFAQPAPPPPPAEVAGIPVNYDEAKIAAYTLPDPLKLANGKSVRDAKTWTQKRRPEIVSLPLSMTLTTPDDCPEFTLQRVKRPR